MITNDYKDCLSYIDSYWDKITVTPKKDTLPYSFIVPNHKKFLSMAMFYWDSYFMFRGLMGTHREYLMKNMVENFAYLFNKYKIIPNFSATPGIGRSQPPFLSSMIFDVHGSTLYTHGLMDHVKKLTSKLLGKDRHYSTWFKKMISVAKEEYETVWIDKTGEYHHHVENYSLARYGDRDVGYAHSSELESGWDFTSRFYNRCDQFLPIDLNCYLYKYEKDFSRAAFVMHDRDEEEKWNAKASLRKKEINKLMWNEHKGFFFDYGYYYKMQSDFYSLAGFIPLWAGLATPEQAQRMVKQLKLFECEYGLIITAKKSLPRKSRFKNIPGRFVPAIEDILEPKQWDYPNIWSPLEYLTVIGLLRYGFLDDAQRIMKNSLKTNATIFRKYKTFYEKINGVTGDRTQNYYNYDNQIGFGWTNAVFYRYIQILQTLESGQSIYKSTDGNPPYQFSILH